MPILGLFERTETGFEGHIKTLTIDMKLYISRVETKAFEYAPDYIVHSQHSTVGYGRIEFFNELVNGKAVECIELRLTDPVSQTLFEAKLIEQNEIIALVCKAPRLKIDPIFIGNAVSA